MVQRSVSTCDYFLLTQCGILWYPVHCVDVVRHRDVGRQPSPVHLHQHRLAQLRYRLEYLRQLRTRNRLDLRHRTETPVYQPVSRRVQKRLQLLQIEPNETMQPTKQINRV